MALFILGQSVLSSSAVLGKSGTSTKYKAMVYHDGAWHRYVAYVGNSSVIPANAIIDSNNETITDSEGHLLLATETANELTATQMTRYKTIIYK